MTPDYQYRSLPRLAARCLILGAVIAGMLAWHAGQWRYDDTGTARHHLNVFNPWAVPPAAPDHDKGASYRSNAVAVCATHKRAVRQVRSAGIDSRRARVRVVYDVYLCPEYVPRRGNERLTRAPPAGVWMNAYTC